MTEWNLQLEKTGGRDGLESPIGYKADIVDVVVRAGRSNMN